MLLWADPVVFVMSLILYGIALIYTTNYENSFLKEFYNLQIIIDMKKEAETFEKEVEIRNLKSRIKVLEDMRIIKNEEDFIQNRIFNTLGNSFHKFSIPSLLIDQEGNVIEANMAFYKAFTKEAIIFNIEDFSIADLVSLFGLEFNNVINKIDYVFDTGESGIIEILEEIRYANIPAAYKIYLTRCKSKKAIFVLMQFIRLPNITRDKCKKYCLGMQYQSSRPVFVVNENLDIIDKNTKAIEYFNKIELKNSEAKIYSIYPKLNSVENLHTYSKLDSFEADIIGNKLSSELTISESLVDGMRYFAITILEED